MTTTSHWRISWAWNGPKSINSNSKNRAIHIVVQHQYWFLSFFSTTFFCEKSWPKKGNWGTGRSAARIAYQLQRSGDWILSDDDRSTGTTGLWFGLIGRVPTTQ
jgi:hypothetical protein